MDFRKNGRFSLFLTAALTASLAAFAPACGGSDDDGECTPNQTLVSLCEGHCGMTVTDNCGNEQTCDACPADAGETDAGVADAGEEDAGPVQEDFALTVDMPRKDEDGGALWINKAYTMTITANREDAEFDVIDATSASVAKCFEDSLVKRTPEDGKVTEIHSIVLTTDSCDIKVMATSDTEQKQLDKSLTLTAYTHKIGDLLSFPKTTVKFLGEHSLVSADTDAFKIGKTPVTADEFSVCVRAGACHETNYSVWKENDSTDKFCNLGRGDNWNKHPMNCVNKAGATEFCKWALGDNARVPSNRQWAVALLQGKTLSDTVYDSELALYSFGALLEGEEAHCIKANYKDAGSAPNIYCDGKTAVDHMVGTSAVGTYSPKGDTLAGMVDMTGNVSEWTSGTIFNGDNAGQIILQGGSWRDALTPANDFFDNNSLVPETAQRDDIGFRCAATIYGPKAIP